MTETGKTLLRARAAAPRLAALGTEDKNACLAAMARSLAGGADRILSANAEDVAAARGRLSASMIDRLTLDEKRIRGMADGILEVAALPDPVGLELESFERPNGLSISKVSVPLGVVGIIYESRPNVTSDAAALCFKSGNVCVLKPGSDALRSCAAITELLRGAAEPYGLADAVCVLTGAEGSRAAAAELMNATGLVDVLIPRGGAGLIKACVENSKVPCIQTGTGICHVYVDGRADFSMALDIIDNAKTQRPSVCNAEEVLLVSRDVAADFLPLLSARLRDARSAAGKTPVELILDTEAARIISGTPAGPGDFDTEFLDYKLAVGVVADVREAVSHIAAHSTRHSDCIVTDDPEAAEYFLNAVDSAAVYHNASTRFTDGGEFGLGCEIGISTQKLHARGPMGLRELTSYKYVVRGKGQTR
jgi:glutamate-5-semialdehyde dehydrogenase